MLDIFKKKEIAPEKEPETPIFVEGQAREFRDPKTGEFVSQRPIPEKHRKEIMTALTKNGQIANQSIGLFRQFSAVIKGILQTDEMINITEKEINEAVEKVRDEYKLDRRWGLNPALMILEKRDPPEG